MPEEQPVSKPKTTFERTAEWAKQWQSILAVGAMCVSIVGWIYAWANPTGPRFNVNAQVNSFDLPLDTEWRRLDQPGTMAKVKKTQFEKAEYYTEIWVTNGGNRAANNLQIEFEQLGNCLIELWGPDSNRHAQWSSGPITVGKMLPKKFFRLRIWSEKPPTALRSPTLIHDDGTETIELTWPHQNKSAGGYTEWFLLKVNIGWGGFIFALLLYVVGLITGYRAGKP